MKKYGMLLGIALIWGSQFMLNYWVLMVFSPVFLALMRSGIGVLTLNIVLWMLPESNKNNLLPLNYWSKISRIAFLEASVPFILIGWGQERVESSVTAVIMASIALFTVVWVLLFVKEERVSKARMMGIGVGFIGVLVLFLPQLLARSARDQSFWGECAILGGAVCFSLSMVLIRKLGRVRAPIHMARDILWMATVQLGLIALAAWLCHMPLWHQAPTLRSLLSVGVLGVFAGGIVYVLYVKLLHHAGVAFTGLTNYFVPVIGVLLGVFVLGEQLSWNIILALVLLIGAMIWV